MLAMMLKSKSTWQGVVQQDLSMTIYPDTDGTLNISILGYDVTTHGPLQLDMDPLTIEETEELIQYLQTRVNQARKIRRENTPTVYRSGDEFPRSAIPPAPPAPPSVLPRSATGE